MPFVILAVVVVVALLFYFVSVLSRKSYRCPQCGEQVVDVEHMSAKRCGMCGAPLERTEENQQ